MRNQRDSKKKKSGAEHFWRLIVLAIAVAAVVQELRKTADDRTWHGKVADVIPYDLRKPTADKIRQTYWNPEGPVLAPKAWGIGWALNLGAIKKLFASKE